MNDSIERKAERAQMLVMMGEVSSGRRALEGAPLAPGNDATLAQLRRRPQEPREPLPQEITGRRAESPFSLDHNLFTQNLRCARRGAAAGPSGVTAEHLKPILDSARDAELLCQAAELLARASIPEEVLRAIRIGRMTALQKPTGGVRGIVAGDIIRRLVSRTIAQQIRTKVEKATAPFQYALSNRAGCECIAHAIQAMTDANPRCTVLSVDGIGAYDTISRRAMLSGLVRHMEGGDSVLPFVLQFYGSPSSYLWEDSEGVVHEVLQGEGGEQGDALMPALFSLGQHDALVAIQGRLAQDERLMAFLDDIYAVGDRPERSGAAYTAIQEELRTHTGIEVHQGKTQLWNRAGVAPAGSAALTAAARVADPSAIVWRGDPHLPPEEQGVKILGTPLGHPSYVRSQLAALTAKHEHLISNILQVQDLQCAWILLLYCASARANYSLRVVHPKLTDAFAAQHDASMRRALSQLCQWTPVPCIGMSRVCHSPGEAWGCAAPL